jgi:hypothetical protein
MYLFVCITILMALGAVLIDWTLELYSVVLLRLVTYFIFHIILTYILATGQMTRTI